MVRASIRLCRSAWSVDPCREGSSGVEGSRVLGGSLVFRGCIRGPNLAPLVRGKNKTTWWFEYKAPPMWDLLLLSSIASVRLGRAAAPKSSNSPVLANLGSFRSHPQWEVDGLGSVVVGCGRFNRRDSIKSLNVAHSIFFVTLFDWDGSPSL